MLAITLGALPACGITSPSLPTADELAIFEAAGPIQPELDVDSLIRGIQQPGPYRVVAGDLLEIEAPPNVLTLASEQALARESRGHLVRVEEDGSIHLPVVGAVHVLGNTMPEVEKLIVDAFYPKFVVKRPTIVTKIADYRTSRVVVLGAVEKAGIQELRHDELTLMGALSKAGGIVKSGGNLVVGARMIKIHKPGEARQPAKPIVLPVKGLNVPFADVALSGGETIEVERYEPDKFSVIGHVLKPGAYDYPPEVTYNLMQCIAVAGGVDLVASPPYATVFRKASDGQIVHATFEISGDGMVDASRLVIKPGDVIALQPTLGSWTRSLLRDILNFNFGVYYQPSIND